MSHNLDPHSQNLNTEVRLAIEDKRIAGELARRVDSNIETLGYRQVVKAGVRQSGATSFGQIWKLVATLLNLQL